MSSKTQSKQRGKIQPLKTVELSEYQKFIIKFTCTNPRNVSAEKDVVETFTLPKKKTLSKEFVALCSIEFVALCVALCGLEGW